MMNEHPIAYTFSLKEDPTVNSEIPKDKYNAYWLEIKNKIESTTPDALISITESRTDKKIFGDLDIIILSEAGKEENNSELIEALGKMTITHTRVPNDTTDHFVLKMQDGSNISADFIRATNMEDFETKKTYYSKHPLSALIGTLAGNLGFSYTQDGFFYSHTDKNGKFHNILITKDLRLGMEILGLDATKLESIKTIDDIQDYIQSSRYFSPTQFQLSNISQKQREHLREPNPFFVEHISDRKLLKQKQERVTYAKISNSNVNVGIPINELAVTCQNDFQTRYPNEYEKVQSEIAIEG